ARPDSRLSPPPPPPSRSLSWRSPASVEWPDVIGARPDQAVVGVLLQHVRAPAADAADGGDRRVQVEWDAHDVIERRRVEVHVAIQPFIALHDVLDNALNRKPVRLPEFAAQLLGHPAQVARPGIFGPVHAM